MDLGKDELQPFNPRDPLYRGKLWVRVVTPDSVWHYVFWRRLAAVLGALVLAGWLTAAGGVWTFVKFSRGFSDVSFLDLAFYPLRAEHYRTSLGRHYIALGRAELEQRNYRNGYAHLAAGVARVPDDAVARRLLAFTEIRFGLTHRALQTLTDGATLASSEPGRAAAADLDYLKLLFGLLLEAQEDDRAIALAQQLLPPRPDEILAHQFTALQAATAHFHRGRYDEAERLLADWHLEKSLEGKILLARCDWERGNTALALVQLEAELARFPARDELYLQLIRFHRELGHLGEARRIALLRHLRDPASPGPRIDLLRTYHASDDPAAESRELASYLADFQTDPSALVLLAWFSVDTAQPKLTQQIYALAAAQQFPLNAFNLARVQAALAVPDYRAALALADTAVREENENNESFAATLNGLRALALFGLKDNARAELTLGSFLNQARPRASDALLLAKQLRLLDAPAQARAVLAQACATDPLNQAALAELVRLDAEAGDREKLAENLPKLLRLRKPSRAALEETLLRLNQPGDAALREQIRAALVRASATPAPG